MADEQPRRARQVAFLGTAAAYAPHFETQLELLQEHGDAGDGLTMLCCNGDALQHCDANQFHSRLLCKMCVARRKYGLKVLGHPVRQIDLADLFRQAGQARAFEGRVQTGFDSVAAMRGYRFEGFDAGEAVLSSFISAVENPEPEPARYPDYIHRAMLGAVGLYEATRQFLDTTPCDLFYLFNGRGATGRGVLRACQQKPVPFYTHERGSTVASYLLTPNTMPHDLNYQQEAIERDWARAASPEREQIGEDFYRQREKGIIAFTDINFLIAQKKNALPEGWGEASERIAIFTSTESEFAALSDFYQNPIYESQTDGMIRIIDSLAAADFKGRLAIRFHPNSQRESKAMMRELERKLRPFVSICPPRGETDTYALMRTATKVITFGSTAGIETTFWGLPSILLGRAAYEKLDATYNPASHAEVTDLLSRPLPPKDKLGALKYGYYTLTYGQPYKHVRFEGVQKCFFKGHRIRAPYLYRQFEKLLRRCGGLKKMQHLEHANA
jgi:hypothetical protein